MLRVVDPKALSQRRASPRVRPDALLRRLPPDRLVCWPADGF